MKAVRSCRSAICAALLLALTWLLPAAAHAQHDTLSVIAGRVVDSAAHAPRPDATVSILGTSRGARTDANGRFTVDSIPAGAHRIRVRSFGYAPVERAVAVRSGDTVLVDVILSPAPAVLGTVQTTARPVEREEFQSRPHVGVVSMSARATEGVPRLGEPDIVRVVQLLPGVEARNDFSTGLNVRGGEADQNLIMIDGFPIYNPFHLAGLFSTFMDPTVRDVTLLTGGFAARYGGRLSSVLDVSSAEETGSGVHGTAEVSLLASTGSLGGSFGGGHGSWMIAGRRTYADRLIAAFSSKTLPYHFRDEQAHATYDVGRGLRLSLTAYDGADLLDANMAQFGDSTGSGASAGRFRFSWGNRVIGATISKSLGRSWLGDSARAEQRISETSFATTLDLGQGSLTLDNSIRDRRIAGSLTTYSANHERAVGYEVSSYHISYSASSRAADVDFYTLQQRAMAPALFFDDMWRVAPSLMIDGGFRLEELTGTSWRGLSPRLSAKYLLNPGLAITGAVGHYSQWLHSLAREDTPVRLFDFWMASDSTIPTSHAWHYILGVERWAGQSRFMRIESFYKQYGQLLESNPESDPNRHGDEFYAVDGSSYGADLLIRQFESSNSRFSGWMSYTYAVSRRARDGAAYFPAHDRRHDLNLIGNLRAGRYLLGARYGIATGTPYTPIIGELTRRVYNPTDNGYEIGIGPDVQFIGGPRNSARLPTTQRLDISVSMSGKWHGASIAPYLSIINAGNARNVFIYVFDYSKSPPTRSSISQIPFFPSIGVAIRF